MIINFFILVVTVVSLSYLGGIVYAALFADRLIFPDVEPSYSDGPEIFTLDSKDGEQIATSYLEAEGSTKLLLYSHGNGEDLGTIRPLLELYKDKGLSVLAYDYPGYGLSSGTASESGVFAAAEAAYNYAVKMLQIAPENIFLYGRSLGSGPSCWLAERYPVGGLILDGAFTSTYRVKTRIKLLPGDRFDNLARLPKIKCPILLLHGKLDRTVPFSHALKNYDAIAGPKESLWIENASHNDLITVAGPQYWETVLFFIRK